MTSTVISIFLFGLAFSSFFLLVGERLVSNEPLTGRSKCNQCDHTLTLLDVFPLIGYLVSKGKCRYCSVKIPVRYPVIELLGAFAYALGFIHFGFGLEFILYLVLVSILIIDTGSDFKMYWVMDRFWIFGTILYFGYHLIEKDILEHVLSSSVLFLLLYLFAHIGEKIWNKIVLGGADIKLFILIGMVVPLIQGFLILFLASLFGLVYGIIKNNDKELRIPFIPFISLATILVVLYGDGWLEWYLSLWKVFG